GDDVLRRRRVHADLVDFALEEMARIGVHGERDRFLGILRIADHADVSLIDRGVDEHVLIHLRRDDEQLWRLERGSDGLALIDLTLDDDTVLRGQDLRVAKVGLGVFQRRLGLRDGRLPEFPLSVQGETLEVVAIHFRTGKVIPADGQQRACAFFIVDSLLEQGLDADQIGLLGIEEGAVTIDGSLQEKRIDQRQRLALLEPAIEIDVDLRDGPRRKRTDRYGADRLDRAGRVDDGLDSAMRGGDGQIFGLAPFLPPRHGREDEGGRSTEYAEE